MNIEQQVEILQMTNSEDRYCTRSLPKTKKFFFSLNQKVGLQIRLHAKITFVCARAASTSSGLVMSVGANRQLAPARTLLLKVLSNEKRGNLKVEAFDRSPFKLFTLRFSNKSVQAPSCERPRTAQRTMFLSFKGTQA
jgi:hypothetical protein